MYESEELFNDDNYFNKEYCLLPYMMFEKDIKIDDPFPYFESYFGNSMTMKENDDMLKEQSINIGREEEEIEKQKYHTEKISDLKTRASDLKSNESEEKYLGNKRELEFEKEEDEKEENEKKEHSTSVKKNIIKGKKEDIFEIFKDFNKIKLLKENKSYIGQNGRHDKFSKDNIIRKIKSYFFNSILRFVNSSTIKEEIENPKKYSKKKLYIKPFFLKFEQEIITNVNIEFNLNLLSSKLKDIFSYNTSKKVEKNHGTDKNKKLVEKIFKDNIQKKTIDILNMTLYQCMEHFRGTRYYEELSGLENEYKDMMDELEKKEKSNCQDNYEKYISEFINLLNTFKEYYQNKNKRKPKTKRNPK